MRPLGFHYPEDRVARSVDDSFLVGQDLLVVPVFDDTDRPVSRTFYVPRAGGTASRTGPATRVRASTPSTCRSTGCRSSSARAPSSRASRSSDVRSVADLLEPPWHQHVYGDVDVTGRTWVGFDGSPLAAAGEVVRHGG